ncbi:ferredoxin family protein [Candidatus Gracilibacteria bacterium]|nr:ferredoxin family protein [Candidatus Gracilibacteria bacterium]
MASNQLLPQIDLRRCTGCARCVELCTTRAITMANGKATIAQPDDCTYCEVCERCCPTGAIERRFTVVFCAADRVFSASHYELEVRSQSRVCTAGCSPSTNATMRWARWA